jgi:hypothetical protein
MLVSGSLFRLSHNSMVLERNRCWMSEIHPAGDPFVAVAQKIPWKNSHISSVVENKKGGGYEVKNVVKNPSRE